MTLHESLMASRERVEIRDDRTVCLLVLRTWPLNNEHRPHLEGLTPREFALKEVRD